MLSLDFLSSLYVIFEKRFLNAKFTKYSSLNISNIYRVFISCSHVECNLIYFGCIFDWLPSPQQLTSHHQLLKGTQLLKVKITISKKGTSFIISAICCFFHVMNKYPKFESFSLISQKCNLEIICIALHKIKF